MSSKLVSHLTAKQEPSRLPGTLWSAIGQPLTRIGAGRYRLTEEYLFFEKGTLSTKAQQIRVAEIFDVDANQSLQQKARGLGTIKLVARRPAGDERVLLEDIPNFREGVEIVNRTADEARYRLLTREHTQHVNYSGAPLGAVGGTSSASTASTSASDLNAELAKLAAFREQGILDDEEFTAAKRRLLGL